MKLVGSISNKENFYVYIDSFLRFRNSTDHESTAMMKAQFMMLWDGFLTSSGDNIIILGATNRPNDVDEAILRRLPMRLYVSKPVYTLSIMVNML